MDWRKESLAVIRDVQKDVRQIAISDKLPVDDAGIYMNLTTLDGERFCIRMSSRGFEIAATEHDREDATGDEEPTVFENPYALLSAISNLYTNSFADRLCTAMNNIPQ